MSFHPLPITAPEMRVSEESYERPVLTGDIKIVLKSKDADFKHQYLLALTLRQISLFAVYRSIRHIRLLIP